jgi:hypothetical protein
MCTRASRDNSPRSVTQPRIIQPEQSTFALVADVPAGSIEQQKTKQIRTTIVVSEKRSTRKFLAANAASDAQLQGGAATIATTREKQSISLDTTPTSEGGKEAPKPPYRPHARRPRLCRARVRRPCLLRQITPSGLERPPPDIDEPHMWTLTDDAVRARSEKKRQSANDEYLYIGCYAFFDSYANTAISERMDPLSAGPTLSPEHAALLTLIRAGHRTHTSM